MAGLLRLCSSTRPLSTNRSPPPRPSQPPPPRPQVYSATHQGEQAAQNSNYLARKKAELAGRLADTEADAAQHAAVLGRSNPAILGCAWLNRLGR